LTHLKTHQNENILMKMQERKYNYVNESMMMEVFNILEGGRCKVTVRTACFSLIQIHVTRIGRL
jgi:hypothetical protein